MHIVDTTQHTWDLIVPNTRGGDIYRKMIRGAEGVREVDYDIRIELFSGGEETYKSIRHRHDFEQLRFAVSGRMDLGFDVLEEGDVGYFPANAYYGPQTCADALILIAQNKLERAEVTLRQALAIDPHDPDANETLATLLGQTGRPIEAEAHV